MNIKNLMISLTIIISILSCSSNAQDNDSNTLEDNLTPSTLMEKYGFQFLKATPLPEELKKELYIPFLENGKYYLADYDGNRVSKQDFDEIILFHFAPYYLGRMGKDYYLYSFPETRVYSKPLKTRLDINNFMYGNAVGYNNNLILKNEEILLPKPYDDTTKIDYTKRQEVQLNKLIKEGVIREHNMVGHHLQVYQYKKDGLDIKLNDNLEVVSEKKPFFTSLDNFDFNSIPEEIRPEKQKIKQPTTIQEYYIINDDKNAHVFTCDGKYLFSQKGWHNEFFSFYGLHRKLKYRRQFIPIGEFDDQGQKIYVRLTDGFVYKK